MSQSFSQLVLKAAQTDAAAKGAPIKTDATKATGAAAAVDDYTMSDAVKALLEKHGVSLYPPNTRIGDRSISWDGRGFVLPAIPQQMGLEEASNALKEKAKEENQKINVNEVIDAMPWDGAQAFARAVNDMFGWGISRPIPGMFGPQPPTIRSIKTGPETTDTAQIMWGGIEIPQLGCTLQTQVRYDGRKMVFAIGGQITMGKRHLLEALVSLTRIYATEKSIYKGKAIRMFIDENSGQLDFNLEPEFLKPDLSVLDQLIFSKATAAQVETNLFTPLRYPEVCRAMGIPLKRGVLIEGPYGTGKSMTAKAAAALAVANGWTFIMINRVGGLQAVLDFAHRYAPVVVFAEDIDRVTEGQDRTVSVDDILNTLDGVQSKSHDIITVLTSNHADKINRAMLRPGRLDAIISVELPDADAAERLMRQYGHGLISPSEDLSGAREALAGRIPAVIREAVERAKLSAIARVGGVPEGLKDEDLVTAAATMASHLGLLYGTEEAKPTPAEVIGQAFVEAMQEGAESSFNRLLDQSKKIKVDTESILNNL